MTDREAASMCEAAATPSRTVYVLKTPVTFRLSIQPRGVQER